MAGGGAGESETWAQHRREMLGAILAREDTPCPACGYNLRGVRGESCVECGSALRVGVVTDSARSGPWLVAIIACSMAIGFDAVASLLMLILIAVSLFVAGGPPIQAFAMLGLLLMLGVLSAALLVAILRRERLYHGPAVRVQWWAAAVLTAAVFIGHLVGGLLIVLVIA